MLVYGDSTRSERPADKLGALEAKLAARSTAGIIAHAALTSAFIEAGELAQGLLDAEFEAAGHEADSPARQASTELLMALARALHLSWREQFRSAPAPEVAAAIAGLRALHLPPAIRCKLAEGHAFYAVYPESYLEAASALRDRGPVRVIGIRSIGTGLAALAAVAAEAPPPISVRPVGHPFRRQLALAPDVAGQLLAPGAECFAVVDEGPGLSGSSFGAVADVLEQHGIERRRIVFLPSHGGEPGPEASEAHRQRWRRSTRHAVDFDALALAGRSPWHRLTDWVADLTGPPLAPLEDLSAGRWRRFRAGGPAPVHPQQERRKFLLRSRSGSWLLKFAGLGRHGEEKLARAQALSQAGFTPPVLGLRHGFLVERWLDEAQPIDPDRLDRGALIARLADYLGFRARHFPALPEHGASVATLIGMLRHNGMAALGCDAEPALARLAGDAGTLAPTIRRIATDNRLQAWEWLRLPGGRLIKTDAVDHCVGHDLIGCQDLAWDVAGAGVELKLSAAESAELGRRLGATSSGTVLSFFAACYCAFHFGACRLAARTLPDGTADALRLEAEARRYAGALSRHLHIPG